MAPGATPAAYDPHSVIVRFKDVNSLSDVRTAALARVRGSFEDKDGDGIYDRFANLDRSGRLVKLDLARPTTVEEALAELRRDPSVEYAEPNYLRSASAIPADPRFNELYGLHNLGQTGGFADADIDAVEAWDSSTGSANIVVGVIDTGIDYNHVDLATNMWVNPGEIPGNFIDDDGNGVIDDVHGFNAINGSGDPMDDHSHGTHCAGTIGAAGGNGTGVVGVNWEVSLMALKFLSAGGSGTTADAIAAIDYAVGMRSAGVNLRVLSNSWGGGGFSEALEDAIEAANQADILFVAAAGNDFGSNNDVFPHYPSSYETPNVVSVAATTHTDSLAFFSNVGPTSVDLGAPGEAILSTVPGDGYALFSGTSMATPHVAGAAALVLSVNETLSTAELKELLLSSGDPISALAGQVLSGKRLNAANALAQAGPPVPRFNLGVAPSSLSLVQAESGSYAVNVAGVAGFTGDVTFSVVSVPPIDATLLVDPQSVSVPGTAELSVATTETTAPGNYQLTITGTSGALVRERQVSLRVRPLGVIEESHSSTDTPLPITDHNTTTSTIAVTNDFFLESVVVDVSMTHSFFADLRMTLTSPTGVVVTLHNRTFDNPSRTFALPTQFSGGATAGTWTLRVFDEAGGDSGTLLGWTLRLSNQPIPTTFALTVEDPDRWVSQLSSLGYRVRLDSLAGFTGNVALSVVSDPPLPSASLFFSSTTVAVPGSTFLNVFPSCSTPPGIYDLTITGQSGEISKTAAAKLTILPGGSPMLERHSFDTPRAIPDNGPNGTTSSISVFDSFTSSQLSVSVDIAHPSIGQLTVQLISPSGATVTLHDRSGGDEDNLRQVYDVPQLLGEVEGTWRLKVIDHVAGGAGSLVHWMMRAADTRLAPVADFFASVSFLSVTMKDFSFDRFGCEGGFITDWHWDFGDGTTSTEQEPTHVYADDGTYEVTLTVTDDDGHTGSLTREVIATRPPPELAIERVTRNRATFEFSVDLTWTGAEGTLVELRRNSQLADIPNNDGAHRDTFRRFETSYTWRICELQTTFCSNQVSVVFGNSLDGDGLPKEATIFIRRDDGASVSRTVTIEDE